MKNEINSCFYYSHTTVNQIVNLCFNIFPKGERKDIVNCITRQATELYEASLCDAVDSVCSNKKFLDESERDACYQEVAKAIFDKEICNSISSEKKRKDCIKIIEISIIY